MGGWGLSRCKSAEFKKERGGGAAVIIFGPIGPKMKTRVVRALYNVYVFGHSPLSFKHLVTKKECHLIFKHQT